MIHDCQELSLRAARRGVLINLVAPLSLFGLAYFGREYGLGIDPLDRPYWLPTLFYVLLAVGLADLAIVVFVLRRALFSRDRLRPFVQSVPGMERCVMTASSTLFALGASPMIYGLVVYLLGGELRDVAVFAIISLLSFRLLRPSAEFLEKAIARAVET